MICQDSRLNVWFSFEHLKNFLRFNLTRVTHSDLHFREAYNPSKMTPGHSWLRKCICKERLRTENATFWAPSIFQKLWALDLRFVDPVGSPSDLWFFIQTYTKMNTIKKTKWISITIMQTWFTFQRCLESLKKTPWSQLPPKVHLRRKVKYWKCRFLSALHFPEIEGCRLESFRLYRFSLKSVIFD